MRHGIGFTFNNRHSSEFNIMARSDDRSLLPEKRRNDYTIPGRDGRLDFGNNTFDSRIISVTLSLISPNLPNLRDTARRTAQWLSGEGLLIFDDEPKKAYRAKVHSPLELSQFLSISETVVPFDCRRPFAESPEYNQITVSPLTGSPEETLVIPEGTADMPVIIHIQNIGTTDIRNITITRKVGI